MSLYTQSSGIALVTGGAGFIGSHLVDRLLTEGFSVRVLDDFSTGKRSNLPESSHLRVIAGDVGNMSVVRSVMEGVECVFHEAAVASVPRTVGDPLGSQRTNYQGTLNVLEAARAAGVRRLAFAASAAAYGDLPEQPKQEDMAVKPLSPYAVDKLASEYACQVYARLYGLQTVCLRYFNVFGPRQDPSSPYSGVISIFADRLNKGQQPTIFGDGGQTRDFVFVSDVVEANMRAMLSERAVGQVFNIATGSPVTLNGLLQILSDLKEMPFAPNHAESRAGDIRHSSANIARARELLGWQPKVDLSHGLEVLLDSLCDESY
jgi:UDP-glucose 4-epimerase